MNATPDPHEAEYRARLQTALGADFELRGLVGRGGFGSVYAAWDRKLERDVAVKALRHDLFPTPVVLERFQREAKALAQLRHPHILPVYEVGSGDGVAFMVTPFIRGDTLGAMFRRGEQVPPADALRWVGEIARALDAAHRAGLVHRDVKPDNILIEGHDRHAVLADFGIAKAAGGADLTTAGVAIGSPKYMSPEQASADREVDARSDIYSLGAVAYELLSGRRPHEAESLQRLLVLQLTTEPPTLSVIAPQVPDAAASAVMRALARDPRARWQTAGELAAALAPRAATQVEERESWFARRGLVLWLLNVVGSYFTVATLVLSDASRDAGGVRAAIEILRAPLVVTVAIVFGLAWLEFVVTLLRNRPKRTDGTWRPALRAVFGQPRWWQPWYPRSLRSAESAWDLMPGEIKLLRTLLWIGLAGVPLMIPLIWGTPELQRIARDAGVPIALPARIVINLSDFLQKGTGPLSAALIPIGVVWVSVARGVGIADSVRLLLTWRKSAWDSPAGLRLRRVKVVSDRNA
jgi:hypothetical protein